MLVHIDRDRPTRQKAEARLRRLFKADLKKAKATVLADPKAALDLKGLQSDFQKVITSLAQDGAKHALAQVRPDDFGKADTPSEMLDLANEHAIAWAEKHAGELMKDYGTTTSKEVKRIIAEAMEEGWSNDELAEALDEAGVFGAARAEAIARTETAIADVAGNMKGWGASGVVSDKQWIVAQDEVCDLCQDMDGEVVGLDEMFDFDGEEVEGPPGHPNCRCDILPVLSEEED